MRTKLNQKLADRLPPLPVGKKSMEHRDIDMPGFLIAQYHTNPDVGTYTLRYRDENGKQRALKIGRTNEISLKIAKALAKIKISEIALGGDPSGEIEKKRSEKTFAEAWEQYYFPDVMQRLRRPEYYRQLYDNRIKLEIGHKKLNSVTRADVQSFHSRLGNEVGAAYANRHLQIIKASYNFFINVLEIATIRNPAVGIPLFEEEGRERFLSSEELSRLMPVLLKAEGQLEIPARVIRFLLATGLRIGECFHCRWEHIDLEHKMMSIPASHAKSKRLDSIPLNTAAIQVLNECDHSTPHPFANPATGKVYVTAKKSIATLTSRAQLKGVTAHVMRHTAASLMINGGHSLYSVQRILRHSSSKVTEKYAHLSTRTLQEASDTISDQLLAASGEN